LAGYVHNCKCSYDLEDISAPRRSSAVCGCPAHPLIDRDAAAPVTTGLVHVNPENAKRRSIVDFVRVGYEAGCTCAYYIDEEGCVVRTGKESCSIHGSAAKLDASPFPPRHHKPAHGGFPDVSPPRAPVATPAPDDSAALIQSLRDASGLVRRVATPMGDVIRLYPRHGSDFQQLTAQEALGLGLALIDAAVAL
jgi:hypothetical protein